MTQPKQPQYDLDKAMSSDAARRIIKRVLYLGYKVDYQAIGLMDQLRDDARAQTVEEADRAYVDLCLRDGIPRYSKPNVFLEKLEACHEARAREAAEDGK